MEHLSDLAINLKAFRYQERDRIVVFLTENHGKVTGLAKGGVNSKRFGGALDFLSCSRFAFVAKPNADMVRIEEAVAHHEFGKLHADFDRLTAASFAAEFCLKLLESNTPSREMFVILSNFLFQLDGGMPVIQGVNAFLCKSFKSMGYPPSLLRCTQCAKPAHEAAAALDKVYWDSKAGGMICAACGAGGAARVVLESEILLYFHHLTMTPFKDLGVMEQTGIDAKLFRILSDFLFHHIPGLPTEGLKSWTLLNSQFFNRE